MNLITVPLALSQDNTVPTHDNELPSLAAYFGDEPVPEQIGTGIPELFAGTLSHNLKHPRMQLVTSAGYAVILKLAGARSKWPGSVHITVETESREFKYCGSIRTSGMLYPKAGEMTPDVHELLVRMAADPVQVALECAQVTGFCSFCRRSLSDPRSVTHGHAKRCAEVWGLRWDAPRAYRGLFGDSRSALSGAELMAQAVRP
jgi:hypothetical protein